MKGILLVALELLQAILCCYSQLLQTILSQQTLAFHAVKYDDEEMAKINCQMTTMNREKISLFFSTCMYLVCIYRMFIAQRYVHFISPIPVLIISVSVHVLLPVNTR